MSKNNKSYPRFRLMARIEHIVLLVSFTVLAISGLPQMYATAVSSQLVIDRLGGIEMIRVIHRWAAFFLTVGSVYHLFTSAFRFFVRREKMRILPEWKDVRDLWDTLRYNLGFSAEPPRMGKFNFGEKLEYWAVIWGTAIMAITGFMLWNPIATTAVLPGQIIPAALAAHGGEAVLAVLSILIWHMYNVLIKHRNFSIFTGKLPHDQMEEEHALELEWLESGGSPWSEPSLADLKRRRQIFAVLGVIVGVLMLAVVIWAATFEETAVSTIPRVTREVYAPLSTPMP